MLILGVDTSGRQGSIALVECSAEGCKVLEVADLTGGTFSAQLIPELASLLSKHGRQRGELAGFAVVSGPGSFTGLRIGLAAIKGLAEILHKPIATVSLLQLVAETSGVSGAFWSALESGKREVFCAECNVPVKPGTDAVCKNENLLTLDEFAVRAAGAVVVTPDQRLAGELSAKGLQARLVDRPRSDAVAFRGWQKIQRGETVLPEQLEADYVGRPDDQIFSRV
jgi:tRNA threonylcarbamoyladenosine biosynthesis protein TsaB